MFRLTVNVIIIQYLSVTYIGLLADSIDKTMEIVVISQNERQVCLRCREKNSAHKLIRICSHRVLEPSGHQQLQLQLITTTYNYERNEVTLSGLQEDILYHVEITCLMSIDGAHKYQTSAAKFFAGIYVLILLYIYPFNKIFQVYI